MGANKISQLPSIVNPSLSGMTVVVDSGTTYNMSLRDLKEYVEDVDIFDVTYSELINLIQTSGLTPMYHYKITDYQTTYWMLDGEGVECNGGVPIIGPIEPLIVWATTTNTIDNFAVSTVYHDDVIEYNWDISDFALDDAFNTLPSNIFKGVITYRREVNRNNSAGWDIRAVKFRRWQSTAPEWNSGTTYNLRDIVIHDNLMFVSLTTNTNREPSLISSVNDWSQLLNLTTNIHWNSNSTGIIFSDIFIPSGPSYFDFPTMELIDVSSFNNIISTTPLSGFGDSQTRLSNIILLGTCNNTNIKEGSQIITVGSGSNKLDLRAGISRMIIGRNSRNLLVRSNCYRLIFADNTFNIEFGSSCNNILLGKNSNDITMKIACANISLAYACKSITIGPNSYSIVIGANATKINIAADSYRIEILGASSSIRIGDRCHDISINLSDNITMDNNVTYVRLPMSSINNRFESNTSGDFSLSTHVIQPYTCVIFRNAGNIVRLRYFDASDINQVVAINV